MRALSIRQPYVELILRGIKTIEYRSRPTRVVGERFHLYASQNWAATAKSGSAAKPWSLDLAMTGRGDSALPWMAELADALRLFPESVRETLPRGVIVGSAIIDRIAPRPDGMWEWHLSGVERASKLRKPIGHPQPVWFKPF